ncbi:MULTISPECIES: DUF2634 domain-containing protein [Pelosinus]|uniref:Phage-like element PBSX protein, XkdS n=1 Tax=Pelosinus fermentans B4 TaxID=1149862 RepID=I9LHQ0_9FIRM|nr:MULTISPECIES: DUF2634 domain-containing protein [Pelosinus]EIW19906.1 Phage-like element PBSX protein, XkdS [Pelosinus fermentans B4]EIW21237.1 hypothetical protein FA11_0964 [Pelosinus fermentans A11]
MAIADKKSPVFDWLTGDFATDINGKVLVVAGMEAAEQVIIKAEQTTRGRFRIYANPDNVALHHKYGNDASLILTRPDITDSVRLSELQRAIKEAIIYDAWVKDVVDIVIARQDANDVYVVFTAKTIFDKEVTVEGVLTSVWPTNI